MAERLPKRLAFRFGGFVAGWPRLSIAAGVAVAVFVVIHFFLHVGLPTAFLIAWDAGVAFFLVVVLEMIMTTRADGIPARAARQDVGRFVVLALTGAATVASLAAIYAELVLAPGASAPVSFRVGLTVITTVLSWFFVHSIFAVHYAHQYYRPTHGEPCGLDFPGGTRTPDYWDFMYFALVIGMTAQVADVSVTDRGMRRTVTAHGLFSFWFNVALLALLINVAGDAIRA